MARYLAFRYRQTPQAKPIIAFVAPAEDIRTWAGVPHKTTDFLGGFQRPLSDRYKQLIAFFDQQGNSSPTAIVVALRPKAVKVTPLQLPGGLSATGLAYKPEWLLVDIPDPPTGAPLSALAQQLYPLLSDRIVSDVDIADTERADGANGRSEDAVAQGTSPDVEEEVPEEDGEAEDWGVDVGKSALHQFAERIKTPVALQQFLAEIAAGVSEEQLKGELPENASTADIESAKTAIAEGRLREVLESLLKPAMIVDGQHRVWGAAESEHEVPFAVCALEDANWRDQVFQFVVVNKQARAISGELLASIVNSSLTNREIVDLEDQLEAAGISTYETRILRILNDDPDSPFQGIVSRGLEESAKKITFKAAIALARRWNRKMRGRDTFYRTLFKPGLPGNASDEKQAAWERVWKDYMFAFWNAIRKLYESEHLWEPGTQLMYRATMECLQYNFLHVKSVAGADFSDPVSLREAVAEFYQNVPAAFFHVEWKRKELLTDDGMEVLRSALNDMRVPGAKFKTLTQRHPLFTGTPTKKK